MEIVPADKKDFHSMVALDKIWGGLQTVIMMDEILRPKKMLQKDREKGSVGFITVVGRSP